MYKIFGVIFTIKMLDLYIEIFVQVEIEHGIKEFTTLTYPTQPIILDLLDIHVCKHGLVFSYKI